MVARATSYTSDTLPAHKHNEKPNSVRNGAERGASAWRRSRNAKESHGEGSHPLWEADKRAHQSKAKARDHDGRPRGDQRWVQPAAPSDRASRTP